MDEQSNDVSKLLEAVNANDEGAEATLFDVVYHELRGIAGAKMGHESPGHTLQATALVHEAYLRLIGENQPSWQNRAHFFGAAAEAMRRILVDWARKKGRIKRGGDQDRVPLLDNVGVIEQDAELVALDEALTKLEEIDERKAEIVKLRYFCGASIPEVAKILDVSPRTVDGDWQFAKSFLKRELSR